jgi:hypothetical protein
MRVWQLVDHHKIDQATSGRLIELLKRAGKPNVEISGIDQLYILLGSTGVSIQH